MPSLTDWSAIASASCEVVASTSRVDRGLASEVGRALLTCETHEAGQWMAVQMLEGRWESCTTWVLGRVEAAYRESRHQKVTQRQAACVDSVPRRMMRVLQNWTSRSRVRWFERRRRERYQKTKRSTTRSGPAGQQQLWTRSWAASLERQAAPRLKSWRRSPDCNSSDRRVEHPRTPSIPFFGARTDVTY